MSSWRKENKIKVKLSYTIDKYRESDERKMEEVCGEMIYVNLPFASTFVNLETDTGKMLSISRDCVLKIEWLNLPKWTLLNEKQVVDSAKMRMKNLDNELEIQKNQFAQEKALEEAAQNSVEAN